MRNLLKYFLICISIFAIGTFLYAQTAVIGIPWELRGTDAVSGTSVTGSVNIRNVPLSFGTAQDLFLYRDAANVLAQRNGANSQTFRIYSSYTDAANYDRLAITALATQMMIYPETAGSGSDNINLAFSAAGTGYILLNSQTLGNEVARLETNSAGTAPNYRSFQNRVTTIDATTTTLQTLTLSDNNIYLIEARVVSRCTGGAGGNAGNGVSYIFKQSFKRSGGAATAIGVLTTESWEDVAVVGWTATLDTSGNDVRVRVTGAVTDNVTWHCTVIVQNLST